MYVLSESRSNHALEINYHMSQLSKIKDTKKYLKRHPTNYQRVIQSILSCEERERNRSKKRRDASSVIRT